MNPNFGPSVFKYFLFVMGESVAIGLASSYLVQKFITREKGSSQKARLNFFLVLVLSMAALLILARIQK